MISKLGIYISEQEPINKIYIPDPINIENSKGDVIRTEQKSCFMGCFTVRDAMRTFKGFYLSFVKLEGKQKLEPQDQKEHKDMRLYISPSNWRIYAWQRTILGTIDLKSILKKYTKKDFSTLEEYDHFLIRECIKHMSHRWSISYKQSKELTNLILLQENFLTKEQVKEILKQDDSDYHLL